MSTVIYVAIVEGDQEGGYSAYFPDLPGCVTASETMLELPAAARDALSLHLQGMAEDGEAFPEPTALEDIKGDADVQEVGRILVDADVEDAPVRVNISIGAQFLKRVDVAAEARGMSRSAFLIEAARAAMTDNGRPESLDQLSEAAVQALGLKGMLAGSFSTGTAYDVQCEVMALSKLCKNDAMRFLTVPTTSDQRLAVIWDRHLEQVVDVIHQPSHQERRYQVCQVAPGSFYEDVASAPLVAASMRAARKAVGR